MTETVDWVQARAQQRAFADILMHDDRESSYVVAWTAGGSWHQRAFRAEDLDFAVIPKGGSVYMSRNGFVGARREAGCCRQVNAMMFDLDCHTATFEQDVPKVTARIQAAVSDGTLPSPNMVVDTGRGLQVYYVLERSISARKRDGSANMAGLAYFKDVETALAETLESVVAGVEGVTLDRSSLDYARVGRVPGTYNPLADRMSVLLSSDGSYYTLEKLKRYGSPSATPARRRCGGPGRKKTGLLASRLAGIERLQRHRGNGCEGSRENMCFVFYNTATQIHGPERALELTRRFNLRFNNPLPPSDIEQIARTVDSVVVRYGANRGKTGFYPLRAQNVIDKLFMTYEEIQAIGFFGTKRQRDRARERARNRLARSRRNERIVYKFRMGMTQQAIADEMGCSKRTVADVLRREGVTRRDRYTLEDKFSQVIERKRESAENRHTSWLCDLIPSPVTGFAGEGELLLGSASPSPPLSSPYLHLRGGVLHAGLGHMGFGPVCESAGLAMEDVRRDPAL